MHKYLLLLLLASCGHIDERQYTPTFDQTNYGEFDDYVTDFKVLLAVHNVAVKYPTLVSIGWVPAGKYLAECHYYLEPNRSTTVSWITVGEDMRGQGLRLRWTIYHELGHCLLGLDHSKFRGDLMYPQVPREVTIETLGRGLQLTLEVSESDDQLSE
jgi:hypothetical protein